MLPTSKLVHVVQDAIISGLAALQGRVQVLCLAGTHNPLKLALITSSSLTQLDLTYQDDVVFGLGDVIASCGNIKV